MPKGIQQLQSADFEIFSTEIWYNTTLHAKYRKDIL